MPLPMLVGCAMLWACAGSGSRPLSAQLQEQTPIALTSPGTDAGVIQAAAPDAGATTPSGRDAGVTQTAAGTRAALPRVWTGRGEQDDGQSWTMELTIRSFGPGHCADVVYPPDGDKKTSCTAKWLCEDDSSDQLLHGVESVTSGRERCIDWCEFSADLHKATVTFKCRDVTGVASLTAGSSPPTAASAPSASRFNSRPGPRPVPR